MSNMFILLLMIFLHIFDDFHLQGILCDMKQKTWWKRVAPDKKYRFDYIFALAVHSFSWAFMMMLPIAFIREFNIGCSFILVLLGQAVIHGVIDDWKANMLKINLWTDQILHLIQIGITFGFYIYNII